MSMYKAIVLIAMLGTLSHITSTYANDKEAHGIPTNRKSLQEIEETIDRFIEATMDCANVPGLTLGVVRDGEVWVHYVYE